MYIERIERSIFREINLLFNDLPLLYDVESRYTRSFIVRYVPLEAQMVHVIASIARVCGYFSL
jgi:hypothetical protein